MHTLTQRGDAALAANIEAARASSTRRAYERAFQNFVAFAGPDLPADPYKVGCYLSDLGTRLKPSTVRLHAAAIAAAHKDAGHPSPTDHAGVRRALRGNANRCGTAQRQATAIDAAAYETITEHAMTPRATRLGRIESEAEAIHRGMVDVALIGLMRDAMLRRSEAAALVWHDIQKWSDGTGRVFIRRSKTDQSGEGAVGFISEGTLEVLLTIKFTTEATEVDSVFGLSDSQICRRITAACTQAGLRGHFSGHSPRIGMAQDLAQAGISLVALMEAGRWKSAKMPRHYIRGVEAGQGAVAQWYGASA